jgi:hypothetical protein
VAVPFPLIRPQRFDVQWYCHDFLNQDGTEKEEVIQKPVERGWGIWYQADVITRRVLEREMSASPIKGEVIGREESLRVLGWMDEVRKLSGIAYMQSSRKYNIQHLEAGNC